MNKLIVLVFTLLFVCTSYAGSNRATETSFSPQKIASFAKQVEKYAAQHGARAFIIARLGQPQEKLPKGIEFTHTAIAVYSEITLSNGETAKGYAIHNLYQNADDSAKSSLVTDYPVDFFWGVSELKAGIIIPSAELQQRIIEVIASGQNQQLHNPRYSLIANPYNNRYQNCTEHTLNIVNAAIYQTTNMSRLKANTKAYFITPQPIHFSRLKLSLGSMFNSGITMKNHQGKIKTTSFTTIANYLDDYDLMQEKHIFED